MSQDTLHGMQLLSNAHCMKAQTWNMSPRLFKSVLPNLRTCAEHKIMLAHAHRLKIARNFWQFTSCFAGPRRFWQLQEINHQKYWFRPRGSDFALSQSSRNLSELYILMKIRSSVNTTVPDPQSARELVTHGSNDQTTSNWKQNVKMKSASPHHGLFGLGYLIQIFFSWVIESKLYLKCSGIRRP